MKKSYMPEFLPILALIAVAASSVASAGDDGWEMGFRGTVVTAGGTPANDIISTGLFFRYPLSKDSALGFAIDQAEYDFERPWQTLGLNQDDSEDVIDTITSSTMFSVWYHHWLGTDARPSRWFVTGGLGFASPDVEDVTGPIEGGGTFDITTDAGNEIIASVSAGWRRKLGTNWSAEGALRLDHHFAKWKVEDRISGETTTVGDYTGFGLTLGMSYRF